MNIRTKTKNDTIKRHKSMTCVTRTLKIQKNKLNSVTKNHLKMLFLEAKWFYNAALGSGDPFGFSEYDK